MYPKPVNTSVQDRTLATLLGKRVIRIDMIEVQAATSANPFRNLFNSKTGKNSYATLSVMDETATFEYKLI